MERKHKNLRDVGLALRCIIGRGNSPENLLSCGRLLRCGLIDGCSFTELRRPRTIVNLRMGDEGHIEDSLTTNGVAMLQLGATLVFFRMVFVIPHPVYTKYSI